MAIPLAYFFYIILRILGKPRYHGLPAVAFIYSLRDLTPFIHGLPCLPAGRRPWLSGNGVNTIARVTHPN